MPRALLLIALMLVPGRALADDAMAPIVDGYLKVTEQLALDKVDGVAAEAAKMATLAAKLKLPAKGPHGASLAALPEKITKAAQALSEAKDLKQSREALKGLSRPLVLWATLTKPKGLNVMYCSMARGSWLQRDSKIRNPYYGSKMLRCGEVVSGPDKGHRDGHMGDDAKGH